MPGSPVTFTARILRKEAFLPRYIVVRPRHVGARTAAFPAAVRLNGAGPSPRSIRPWGTGSAVFFFNPTARLCEKAALDTDDTCVVTLMPQD